MSIADYIKNGINKWPNWLNLILLRCNIFGGLVYGRSYARLRKHIGEADPKRQLLDMVNYAIKNVPYYRKRYGSLHIGSIEEFERHIGFIDKDEVMAHWEEFLADGIDMSRCVCGTTGGTSGKPLKLVMPKNRYGREMMFWHKGLKRFGWNYDTRAVMRNHHLPDNRRYLINPILKEIIFDPFRMNAAYAEEILKTMKRLRVRFIHAYPSAAYQFLKLCRHRNLDTSFIRACFLASETVTVEQRTFIEEELGIDIFSFYGHSEKLIFAGNIPGQTEYYIEESYGYMELVDKNGAVIRDANIMGEMVGTTNFNRYFPLIRYRTGDYSSYAVYSASANRILNTVVGRRNKSLIYRNDGTTTSITALNLHGEIYTHIDGLQYIQERVGYLRVMIIKNELYDTSDEQVILEMVGHAMGGRQYVSIEYVDRLILQSNCKFLPLISMVYN